MAGQTTNEITTEAETTPAPEGHVDAGEWAIRQNQVAAEPSSRRGQGTSKREPEQAQEGSIGLKDPRVNVKWKPTLVTGGPDPCLENGVQGQMRADPTP